MRRVIFVLIFVGLLVYFNSFFNSFVMDDQSLIVTNQNVHSIFNILNFFRGSIFDYGGNLGGVYYRPIMSTAFSLIYTLFGPYPFYFHFVQVALHITNSILLLYLLSKFFRTKVAFVLSLIFLVHPLNTESVSYIAALQDILFFFFGMWYLLLIERFDRKKWTLFIPYLFLLAGILSKETGMLFLPLGLLYVYIFKKKLLIEHLLISGALFFGYLLMRVFVGGIIVQTTGEFVMMRLPFFARMVNVPSILFYYLKTFFVPIQLISVQSWVVSAFSYNGFVLPLVAIVVFTIALLSGSVVAFKHKSRGSVIIFFWLWFVLGLFMHVQLMPLDSTVADRWFYFPMAGLLGILGILISKIRIPKQTKILVTVFVVVLITALSLRTIIRTSDWRDTKTLAMHDLKIQPDNYQLLSALGAVYLGEKKYDKAIYFLRPSVKLFPYWGTSQYNLGVSYHLSGHLPEAKKYYNNAISDAPYYINAYENMAILLFYNEQPNTASEYTKKALAKFPNSSKMWHILALSEAKLGHTQEATHAAQMYYMLTAPR